MRKTLLTLTAAAAVALVGVPAYAQVAPSLDSPSCAEALTKFQDTQKKIAGLPLTVAGSPLSGAALDAAVEADQRVADARKAVGDARLALTKAEAELAAAVAEDNAQKPPAKVDSERTKTAKAAVVDAKAKVATAEGALTSALATVRGELRVKPTKDVPNPALAEAKKEGDDAKVAADTACKGAPGAPGVPGAPGFVDLDCDDFPSQAAAQAKLDETPGADPHRLDTNNNRIACEVAENENTAPASAPVANTGGGGFTQVGADDIPVGGVNTGA